MRRLSGLDASFLAFESPLQPMHGMVLAIIRPPVDGQLPPLTLEALRRHIGDRLDALPSFRWRLVPVPLGLYHPLLVEDPEFDLDRHVHQVTLASPGGVSELDRFVASHAAQLMDRARPLWEAILVDGLSDGRQAVLLKIHHCLTDGRAVLVSFSRLFSDQVQVPADPARPEGLPGRLNLVLGAMRDYARASRRFPQLVRTTRRGGVAVERLRQQGRINAPEAPLTAPYSMLNNGFSPEHGYARRQLPVEAIDEVAKVARVSMNDVVLAVVSGALRRYLVARDGLPEQSLVSSVLVGLDPPGAPARQWGNRISNLTIPLCTDVTDPWVRLRTIHELSSAAKRIFVAFGSDLVTEGLDLVPPWLAGFVLRRRSRKRLRHPEAIEHNVVLSSVKGLDSYATAAFVVEEAYFSGPPNSGVGVAIALCNCLGTFMVTVTTFMDSMDAPDEFADLLEESLHDLVARARIERPDLANRTSA